MRRVPPRTLGAEEEFHLVDLKTRRLTARAPELLAELSDDYVAELQRCVVETNTRVVDSLGGLRSELVGHREVLVETAAKLGIGVVAAAMPLSVPAEMQVTKTALPANACRLSTAGARAGAGHGIAPAGYRALDSLRIEKGYRYMGTDLTASDTPYDAGLSFCVALDKGPFNGRDALAAAGPVPERRIRTLLVGGRRYLNLYGGEAVHAGGSVAGRVRSCAFGHTVGRNVAYAYLPAEIGPGTTGVQVEVLGQLVDAEVAEDVLYDPDHLRVRA